MTSILLRPVTRDQAVAFLRHHRHAGRPAGYRAAIGAEVEGRLVGVAIVGRPVARHSDDGRTLEILRLCTDGTDNACSFLLGWARRLALALGYERVVTFTLPEEGGASLRAAGFAELPPTRGGTWGASRPRADRPREPRVRWESLTDPPRCAQCGRIRPGASEASEGPPLCSTCATVFGWDERRRRPVRREGMVLRSRPELPVIESGEERP